MTELKEVPRGEWWKIYTVVGVAMWAATMVLFLAAVVVWRWPFFAVPILVGGVSALLSRYAMKREHEKEATP